jgi:hypothetical protein
MEFTRLGNTGLRVSRLGLGCMSYGDPTTPSAHPWALIEDAASPGRSLHARLIPGASFAEHDARRSGGPGTTGRIRSLGHCYLTAAARFAVCQLWRRRESTRSRFPPPLQAALR